MALAVDRRLLLTNACRPGRRRGMPAAHKARLVDKLSGAAIFRHKATMLCGYPAGIWSCCCRSCCCRSCCCRACGRWPSGCPCRTALHSHPAMQLDSLGSWAHLRLPQRISNATWSLKACRRLPWRTNRGDTTGSEPHSPSIASGPQFGALATLSSLTNSTACLEQSAWLSAAMSAARR